MYLPNTDPNSIDDKDTMAVVVPSLDHYLGLREFGSRGTREIMRDPYDVVIYETTKVMRLLAQGNPNVLSLLWIPENLYIKRTEPGDYLIKHREVFVGQHVYMPFVGYANQQFQKMTRGVSLGYMGEKRKQLVEKYGYDPKAAAHLIRLLRMGIEFLRDGELNVDRGGYDATELLTIKRGEWTLEQVKEEAARLFRRAEEVRDRSTLPLRPEPGRTNKLCTEVVWMALERRGELNP